MKSSNEVVDSSPEDWMVESTFSSPSDQFRKRKSPEKVKQRVPSNVNFYNYFIYKKLKYFTKYFRWIREVENLKDHMNELDIKSYRLCQLLQPVMLFAQHQQQQQKQPNKELQMPNEPQESSINNNLIASLMSQETVQQFDDFMSQVPTENKLNIPPTPESKSF